MLKLIGSRLLSYAFALLTVAVTIFFILLINEIIDVTITPFLLFFVPVIFSSLYGGLEAGLLATVITALALAYFFLPPRYNLNINQQEILRISLFIFQGVLLSSIIGIFQTTRRKLQANFQKLQTKDEQLRLALESVQMGTWDWNITTDKVTWSKNHELLFGMEPGSFNGTLEAFLQCLHPEDRELAKQTLSRALEENISYEDELRIIWPDGSIHWITAKGKFFYDQTGKPIRMLGVNADITSRKEAEQQRIELLKIDQEVNKQITNIFESITDAFVALDRNWRITYVNQETARINNKTPAEMIGKTHWEQWPWSVGTIVEQEYRRAISEQVTVHLEMLYEPLNMWLDIHAYPSPEGLNIYFRDISDRKQQEIAQQFVSQANKVLVSSLDYETTLTSVVQLAVPQIADWCAIDIVAEDGSIKRLAVAHVDPAKVEFAYELYRRYPPNLDNPKDAAMNALRTQKSALISDITEELLINSATDAEQLQILRELNLKSCIVVPLIARNRALGVITFITSESGKHYQLNDLNLAEELAANAALAIDNARLYRDSEASRQAAQAAEQRKDEYLALLDTLLVKAPIGFAFFNPELRCVRINDYIANINGVSVEKSIGRTIREYLPEYADIVEPILHKIIETGEPVLNVEISGETQAGLGEMHAIANYYPVYSKQNKLLGIGVVIANITTLKQQAKIIQKQQEWLEDVLNLLPTPLLFIEPGTARVTFANKAADELAGGEFPKNKPAEEYHTIYYCTDDQGNRIPDEQMPGVRVARGEKLHGFEMDWHTQVGLRRLVVFGDTLPSMHGYPPLGVIVFQDIAKVKQIEQALRKSEARLRRLVDSNIIGIIFADREKIIEANNAFLEMVGYSREDLIAGNIRWQEMTPPEYLPLDMQGIEQLLEDGICTPFEKEYIRKDGSRIPILLGGAVVEQNPLQWVCFILDLTKIKQLEKALRQQTQELQQANRMKDEFLAVVSHELRSPLNAILGWANLLRSRQINEDMMAKALETIERNARSQKQLIEDLLDVSRIITGKLRLNVQSLEFAPIIQTVIESLHPAADAKEISLNLIVDPACGQISGDSERLQQVIWNLLSNAIKFTPQGGRVDVKLSAVHLSSLKVYTSLPSKMNNYAEITVTDTGMGIEPEFLPYVFDRFRQADSTTTRSYGGLGLGLAIVRHLVELHGGTVGVTSPGKGLGATFIVNLPLARENEIPKMPQIGTGESETNSYLSVAPSPSQPLYGVHILIVDDDPDAREFLTTALQQYGAIVKNATSVPEALLAIEQSKPDILLSDIGMPLEDGYSLIRKIRALSPERGGNMPAIALTAYARREDRKRAIAEGFQTHLSKPIEPDQLVKVIANLINKNYLDN